MPRGIYHNPNATVTVYIDSSEWVPEGEEDFGPELWRETIDYIMEMIEARWPSFCSCDRWDHEDHILLENNHAVIAVYEDNGTTSISLVPRDTNYQEYPELAEHWCSQISDGLQAMMDQMFKGHTMTPTSGYTMRVREVAA